MKPEKYAFVVPRYGRDIFGGAETLVAGLAKHLSERGDQVEVWTTTARDNRTWHAEFKPGCLLDGQITVRRFSVDQRNLDLWIPKQIAISQGLMLTVQDELEWLEHSVNSKALYHHIAQHAQQFKAVFYGPYLFGTTFWGSLVRPANAVLIPCLHDEHYARTQAIGSMFKQVRGCLFNAKGEQQLAHALYGELAGAEVGMGFVAYSERYVRELDPYFDHAFPYILCLGRKETGKNAQLLIDYFIAGKESGLLAPEMQLVIAGAGEFKDLERPEARLRNDILDIGHTTEEQKRSLIRYALCVCQPSLNESFSIVLMEAWLLLRPVLVHAGCAVTREHVVESGGGLYFANLEDFIACIQALHSSKQVAEQLGAAGRRYVCRKYDWSAVLKRFDSAMHTIFDEVPLEVANL